MAVVLFAVCVVICSARTESNSSVDSGVQAMSREIVLYFVQLVCISD